MNIVERIVKLIKEKGISEKIFLNDLSLNRTLLSDWKSGKSKSYHKYATKIAEYFGVSTDYLLTGKISDKNHPENDVTFDDFTYAFMEESGELSEKDKQTLLDMARLMRKRQHEERRDKN